MMYMGADQVYTHTVQYTHDESCPACGPGTPVEVSPTDTLKQVRHKRAWLLTCQVLVCSITPEIIYVCIVR